MSQCTRGGMCNFMHLKPVSRDLKSELYEAQRLSIKILNPRPEEALREQRLVSGPKAFKPFDRNDRERVDSRENRRMDDNNRRGDYNRRDDRRRDDRSDYNRRDDRPSYGRGRF